MIMNMNNCIYSETRYIKSRTEAISNVKLSFKGGQRLGDLSLGIEDNATKRKVRRIVEKRVCQDYYKAHPRVKCSARHAIKRNSSNTLKNIYGVVPEGFRYMTA